MAGHLSAPPGRRRANGTSSASPRDEIIAVATRLFAEQGYANTTMTMVAKACGMRQASLYYWFGNKRELLRATAAVNRHAVAVTRALAVLPAPPPVKLHRLLYEDTRAMCTGPCDYNEIERLAAEYPDDFGLFWDDYDTLFAAIAGLVRAGIADGDFASLTDVSWAAAAALITNEGVQKMYRYGPLGKASRYISVPGGAGGDGAGAEAGDAAREALLHGYAVRSASTTLAGLLVERGAVENVAIASAGLRLELGVAE